VSEISKISGFSCAKAAAVFYHASMDATIFYLRDTGLKRLLDRRPFEKIVF
jgi:hypothetical protein